MPLPAVFQEIIEPVNRIRAAVQERMTSHTLITFVVNDHGASFTFARPQTEKTMFLGVFDEEDFNCEESEIIEALIASVNKYFSDANHSMN